MINKNFRKNAELHLSIVSIEELMKVENAPDTKFYQALIKEYNENLKPDFEKLKKTKLFSKKRRVLLKKKDLEEIRDKVINLLSKLNSSNNTTEKVMTHNDLLFRNLDKACSLLREL